MSVAPSATLMVCRSKGSECESFKRKTFNKWAAKTALSGDTLRAAVDEMGRGLIDANLGGHVVKKR